MTNEIDWESYRFRASSIGHIMTDPKGKSNRERYNGYLSSKVETEQKLLACSEKAFKTAEKLSWKLTHIEEQIKKLEPVLDVPLLSDSCKTHLANVYTKVKYNRTEDIKSKYLKKGLHMEEDAITLVSLVRNELLKKNDEQRQNEYVSGFCDIEEEDCIDDTKVNWSIFQFTRVAVKPILPLYHWQLDVYMWLWNKPNARLYYCLVNTPEHLIKAEEKQLLYDFNGTEADYKEACLEIRRNHTYDDIPQEEKIRVFEVKFDQERIDKIIQRVKDCRKFLQSISDGTLSVSETEETEETEE